MTLTTRNCQGEPGGQLTLHTFSFVLGGLESGEVSPPLFNFNLDELTSDILLEAYFNILLSSPGLAARGAAAGPGEGRRSSRGREEERSEVLAGENLREEGQESEGAAVRGVRDGAAVAGPAPNLHQLRGGARDGGLGQHGRPRGPRRQGGL